VLEQHKGENLRVLVVWEPVLVTDWSPPSSATMQRVADARVEQFWDHGRLVSKAMSEHDGDSVVWDWVGVYGTDAEWAASPPKALYSGGTVVHVLPEVQKAIGIQLSAHRSSTQSP
jgi:hypothetical protein